MSTAWLDRLERAGNRLPDPATLFLAGTLVIMALSQLAVLLDWSVVKAVKRDGALVSETVTPVGLLDSDGLWWAISGLVENFVGFPPLGLVLVGLLGIGVAERSGLLPVLLGRLIRSAPQALLVPATVLTGIMSSLALDAGYVVLPPLAAGLFLAAGRSPLAGIAAATAGVTAGFSANLLITGLDPLLAGLSTAGAQVVDADYAVAVTANWWFMIASTLLLTLAGTATTRWLVEPRLERSGWRIRVPGPEPERPEDAENRGLRAAGLVLLAVMGLVLALVLIPGAPLNGAGERFPRWMEAIVPLLLVIFLSRGWPTGSPPAPSAAIGMQSR